jgi:DNA-directed RNA polymerase specialized sigma24 family protein
VAERLHSQGAGALDEVGLARGVRRGDSQAFEAFYERYFDAIYAFASRRRPADEAEVEALAERIWLRAIDALDDFPGDLPLGTWLHAIACATARGAAPRVRGEAAPEEPAGDPASGPPADPDPVAGEPAPGAVRPRRGGSSSASRRRDAGRPR